MVQPREPMRVEDRVPIEPIKLDTEAEILKRHIPINVEPLIAGLLEPAALASGVPYSNPFDLQRVYADLQIPPPIVVNMDDYDLSSTSYTPSEALDRRDVIGPDSSVSSTSLRPDLSLASLRRRQFPPAPIQRASDATSLSEGEVRPPESSGERPAYADVKASLKSRVNFDSPSSGYVSESVSGISQGQLVDLERHPRDRMFNPADSTFSEGELPTGQNAIPAAHRFFEEDPEPRLQGAQAQAQAPKRALGREMQRPHEPVSTSQASFGARASLEAQRPGLYMNLSEQNQENDANPPLLHHFIS
jgi:hypothetical protein